MGLSQFVDLPSEKKKKIIKSALHGAIKMQKDLLERYDRKFSNTRKETK